MKFWYLMLTPLLLFGSSLLSTPVYAGTEKGVYIEVNGGGNTGIGGKNGSSEAGAFDNGQETNIKVGNGTVINAKIGCWLTDNIRADLSYTNLSSDLSWNGIFASRPGWTNNYTSQARSEMLLVNVYYYFIENANEEVKKINPFINLGVGLTKNKLSNIFETNDTSSYWARPADGTDNNIVPAIGLGADYVLNSNWTITAGVNHYWLGKFKSGDSRLYNGTRTESIGPWQTDDVKGITYTLGLRYSF